MIDILSPQILKEEKSEIITVTLPHLQRKHTLIQWWSQHDLNENQKISLCLVHKGPVDILHKNICFLDEQHLEDMIVNAHSFPYLVAPDWMIEHVRSKGLNFGVFRMDATRPGFVYNIRHYSDGRYVTPLIGPDIRFFLSRFGNGN